MRNGKTDFFLVVKKNYMYKIRNNDTYLHIYCFISEFFCIFHLEFVWFECVYYIFVWLKFSIQNLEVLWFVLICVFISVNCVRFSCDCRSFSCLVLVRFVSFGLVFFFWCGKLCVQPFSVCVFVRFVHVSLSHFSSYT